MKNPMIAVDPAVLVKLRAGLKNPALFVKSHVEGYTRKDGTYVSAYDTSVTAKPKASGGYAVRPGKHGGHQIVNPDGKHHINLDDKGFADRHAAAMNHVAKAGKNDHMAAAVAEAGKKHLGLDSFKTVNSDREDFVDIGKVGAKRALEHAYDAGAGHSKGGAHRDAVVAEAAKHFVGFDTLDPKNSDSEDFMEGHKGLIEKGLQHAYAAGAQKAGGAKPKAGGGYVAPKDGEVGHHEHTQYGAYFREGDKVRDQYGKEHEVSEHRGPEVLTTKGERFHPTKLTHVSSKAHAGKPTADGGNKKIPASSVDVRGDDHYQFTHGKKPSGRGMWFFSPHKSHDFGKHGDKPGEHFFVSQSGTSYSEAKEQAKKWAAEKGHNVIHLQT